MAILKIARMGHPVLLQNCEPVTDPGAPAIRRLVADMMETMEDASGAGLAAPQVHVPLRLFVFRVSEALGQEDADDVPVGNTVVINPEVELLTDELVLRWEGCLSIPGLRAAVPRAPRVRYRRHRLRWRGGRARGIRLPCRRGAARVRSFERHPLSDADERLLVIRIHRGTRPRRGGAKGRVMPPERSLQRDAAIAATLSHVPFDGWTYRALRHGLAGIGASPEDAAQLFPRGASDMIEAFGDWADRQMEQAAASLDPALPLHRRVRSVIALRLEQNRPYKEAIRRALAQLALPGTRDWL